MFEAGVRSGDTLCVLNPTKLQDNLIGSKLAALKSMQQKGVTKVVMPTTKDKIKK